MSDQPDQKRERGSTALDPALADAKGLERVEEPSDQSDSNSDLAAKIACEPTPAPPPTEADPAELAKPNQFDSSLEAEAIGGRGSEKSYPEADELKSNTGLTGRDHLSSEPSHDPATPERDADFQAPQTPTQRQETSRIRKSKDKPNYKKSPARSGLL